MSHCYKMSIFVFSFFFFSHLQSLRTIKMRGMRQMRLFCAHRAIQKQTARQYRFHFYCKSEYCQCLYLQFSRVDLNVSGYKSSFRSFFQHHRSSVSQLMRKKFRMYIQSNYSVFTRMIFGFCGVKARPMKCRIRGSLTGRRERGQPAQSEPHNTLSRQSFGVSKN